MTFSNALLDQRQYVLHDRDTKFCSVFRTTLTAGGIQPIQLPARTPNLNSHAERWVRSVKGECLSKLILFGGASLRRAVTGVWMEVAQNDIGANSPSANRRNWVIANQRMAAAMKAKGYHYQLVYAKNVGHVDAKVINQTLPQALEFLWKGYPIQKKESVESPTSNDPSAWGDCEMNNGFDWASFITRVEQLDRQGKAVLLAKAAYELTMRARDTYEPGTRGVSEPARLRGAAAIWPA